MGDQSNLIISKDVLEEYLNTKYKEILELQPTIGFSDLLELTVVGLLEFECLLKKPWRVQGIRGRYNELINQWYKNMGQGGVTDIMNEAVYMVAKIIREEMKND